MSAPKVTKTALIRQCLLDYPEWGPTAIAKRLASENPGVKFTPQEISTIKTRIKTETAEGGSTAPSNLATVHQAAPERAAPASSAHAPNAHVELPQVDPAVMAGCVGDLMKASQLIGKDKAIKLLQII